jgi:valyl-tRNA synthetase
MDKRIDYKKIEEKWQAKWNYQSKINDKEKFSIVIPPPNVTGVLHMGHALNNTFQDVLCRYYRNKGYNVCWVPGTDHAGIATQSKVEKELEKEGIKKDSLSRNEFINKIYEWKDKHGGIIINQLKKLGCSCDWSREQFTMNKEFSNLVKECFVKLFNDGLIYQDNYMINWCPVLQTAIADEEVETKEIKSKLYYIKYYLDNDNFVTVATSRPETIFGDIAIAYNPLDERYKHLKNRTTEVPIIKRKIKFIEDSSILMDFGTGLVKITPCHDKLDYEIGKRHNLEFIQVIDKNGQINFTNTKYDTMPIDVARRIITRELKELGNLDKIVEYNSTSKICYRSGANIEPMITKQWFLKMDKLANIAKEMVDNNKVEIKPEKCKNIFYNWVNNIHDWCISRQLVWGHQIPVYYCENNHINCSINKPEKCDKCSSEKLNQDPDVLDTWFSSWLWVFGVFKEEELEYYFPTDVLITGEDILYFWVIKMMMASGYFLNKVPFKKVYLHGIIRDENNKKMSKSLGNVINPLDVIEKYGTDPMRFSLMLQVPFDQDMCLGEKMFNVGKTFCTKYWNVVRFLIEKIDKFDKIVNFKELSNLEKEDQEIISKYESCKENFNKYLEQLEFSKGTKELYKFVWDDYANCYLEFAKDKLTDSRKNILGTIIIKINNLLNSIIPHVTDEISEILKDKYNY